MKSPACVYYLFYMQGLPFPSQEFNAVDVIVRYAVSELGFAFQDIIMYAWSIGKLLIFINITKYQLLQN